MNKKRIHLSALNLEIGNGLLPHLNTISYPELYQGINRFEEDLCSLMSKKIEVLAVNSGTAAIHLALMLAGVGKGDEVLCQSLTFIASANPILYQQAIPIFVDSESETWNMCPVALREAFIDRCKKGKKPKAIVLTSLYGMPFAYDEIKAFAQAEGVALIDDSAEALGSSYKGISNGCLGDYGIISFNTNKIITTLGGGALFCSKNEDRTKALYYASQAKEKNVCYHHKEQGYTYLMSYLSAALGSTQLPFLKEKMDLRIDNFEFYKDLFGNFKGVTFQEAPTSDVISNRWLTAICIDPIQCDGVTKEDLRKAFAKENIESRPVWKPMHMQPLFEDAPFYGNSVSDRLFEQGLCLPSGSNLTMEDRNRIKSIIFTIFKLR